MRAIKISLSVLVMLLAKTVYAQIPAGFSAMGSALTETSDWVVEGNKIVTAPGAVEYKFPLEPTPTFTSQEQSQGYAPYVRHYAEIITSSSRPTRDEIGSTITVFASKGEYQAASAFIFAIQNQSNITTEVSDLVAPDGSVIPKENIDIRVMRRLVRTNDGASSPYYYWPLALEKKTTSSVSANDNLQFWLTFYIPRDANATVAVPAIADSTPTDYRDAAITANAYSGTFTVHLSGRPDAVFPITLAVLPFELSEPQMLYGMWFLPNAESRGVFPNTIDKMMVDMRQHGLNSMVTFPDMDVAYDPLTLVKYDFTVGGIIPEPEGYFSLSLERIVDSYVAAGFTRTWVNGSLANSGSVVEQKLGWHSTSPSGLYAMAECVRQMRALQIQKGWPDFILANPIDEPHADPWLSYAVTFANYLKTNCPTERLFVDYGPWNGENTSLIPCHDVLAICQPSPTTIGQITSAGKEFWLYNVGFWGHRAKWDRITWGLMGRRMGAKANFQWVYQWWWAPSSAGGFPTGIRYTQPAPDGPIPTPSFESVREGIDDERYAQTLLDLADRAGQYSAIAAAAKTKLNQIVATYPDAMVNVQSFHDSTASFTFEQNRWELARQILNLMIPGNCGDRGYLLADINKDCYVDINDLMEFASDYLGGGEVIQNTYTYSGAVPGSGLTRAYACDVDQFPFAGDVANLNTKVEAGSTQLNAIMAQDSSRWRTVDPGYFDEMFMWFEMKINEPAAKVTQLDMSFSGYSDTTAVHELYVKKAGADWKQDASWTLLNTATIMANTDGTLTGSVTSNPGNYIDANGVVVWGVHQADDTAKPMNINYVQLAVSSLSSPADLNGDEKTDLLDFAYLAQQWLECTDPVNWATCGFGQ